METVSELCFSAFNSFTACWTGLTWGRILYQTGGNFKGFFFFISSEICILLLYYAYLCSMASSSGVTSGLSLKESFVACTSWSGSV